MDVSSSTDLTAVQAQEQKDPIKKAVDMQSQQALKILDDLQEQSQKISAHKTGIGKNLNVSA